MTDDQLKALIRTVPDFPAKGIQFRDITTLLADGEGLAACIDRLTDLARPLNVQAIAGIEARGFIFGTALAMHLGTGFIPMRKAGKLPVPCLEQSYALEYGEAVLELDPTIVAADQHVLVVDDLLATGGTALAAAKLLRKAGARVEHALFAVDLPELGGAAALASAGVKTHALLAFDGH
ncbi:adenine phosphoribosyltransferase [Aurantiacibacter gangjinensis]|uniref:Adenine phosphoribosyltransferase n=1 Tax=Aurantiacibacter gangjinensis TaxID=502682 RepID=A0A0G9MM05_9SPHN|nr:adenine phosphoribosyltransferase [Aurantiacibacter gangjinensis]APE27606.1 Adenine phosphoribosyltransferase [Aurantiacibacter gangjinensis]KLE31639.1 adenine phosphoribosyltransferase [Aurantiacibacter gangjinensis]